MNHTKTILFDLGNVLVPFEIQRGYQAFSELTGLPPQAIATRLQNSTVYADYESGRLNTEEFHQSMQELLQFSFSIVTLREAWNRIFLPEPATSEDLLLALKKNHRLVLLSNTNELHFHWLREHYPLLGHFDAYTLSYEVQAMKPEAAIYQRAIQLAQCEPHECFYTDDIPKYVEAARTHGIRAEPFTTEAQLRAHLTAHQIVF
ncbi:HAD family phosphatase [Nostoc sp. NIES-2111]